MNQLTIAGHLGADPEVRFTSSGKKVTTLRVAARARGKKEEDNTIWWRVTIWGEQFDNVIPHFKKGSPIIVTGDLSKPEIFTDREGRPQVSMNITAYHIGFSPFGRQEQGQAAPASQEPAFAGAAQAAPSGPTFGQGAPAQPNYSDDEIPF